MARFDATRVELNRHLDCWRADGRLRLVEAAMVPPWPEGRSLVISADLAVELGNPAVGSWSLMIWPAELDEGDTVGLVGPDVSGMDSNGPLGRLVLVRAVFKDEAMGCLELREGVCDTRLEGVTLRTRPSSGEVWTRVSRKALRDGFSLNHLGAAIVRRLRRVDGVTGVTVIWVTDSALHKALEEMARETERIAGALLKRHGEDTMECQSCDYADICDESEQS